MECVASWAPLRPQLTGHRSLGTKIGPCNLEEACKGRVANEIDDLMHFANTGHALAWWKLPDAWVAPGRYATC
jgi:hypothetical protein